MAKEYYMPRTDEAKALWLSNFISKLNIYFVGLGFTAAEMTSLKNDVAYFSYILNAVEVFTTAKEHRVNYKNALRDGPIGTIAGAVSDVPALGTKPVEVAPGIIPRITQAVQRIKNSPAYTESMGKDLGIIGAITVVELDEMQPILKPVLKGGDVEVRWTKGEADAVYIEVDRGNGVWQFLGIDMNPHYMDKMPITAHATWRYRAIYLKRDERIGRWSDVASIAVG